MADNFLPEEAVWEEGIRQVETTDTVLGGPGGIPNIAPGQLANRTLYLKQKIEANPLSMVGLIGEFHNAKVQPGWLDLKGGEVSRSTDELLWNYAVSAGMVIAQATKDADPMTHAMKFGDGDGETTFTLPNHHLGHFVRGTPSSASHGETQDSQNKAHTHGYTKYASIVDRAPGGTSATWQSETTTQTDSEGGSEARPLTANLSIKIHRGWM